MRRLAPSHPFTMPTFKHELASASLPNPLRHFPPSPPSSHLMLSHPHRSQSRRSCGTLMIYLLRPPRPSLHLLPPPDPLF
ncbi:hypothetical protein O181_094549 [Austropuccinia psidii MF-1]|uniref:Uncharacterized protein n=1 Tax=Austropuccinia psidii MF-1 TaxID=1389203 RepID=A0A9Q3J3D8_9BASI|nr:hypothetical protein [Austropuccinia psidii MF-1]